MATSATFGAWAQFQTTTRSWFVFAAALVALVGWAGTPGGEDPAEDSPIITLNEESDSWPDALIKGRLSEREG